MVFRQISLTKLLLLSIIYLNKPRENRMPDVEFRETVIVKSSFSTPVQI